MTLAMGSGQQDQALTMLHSAAKDGCWLCLKNIHLVIAWLPLLERELRNLKDSNKDFMLWIMTEHNNSFPSSLLESVTKIAYESPPGVKENLMRTYAQWSEDIMNSEAFHDDPMMARILFALGWLHALVQERRRYIPQGWKQAYEFSEGDLRAGVALINVLRGKLDWETIHGLIENFVYGGRVDDPYDQKVLNAYVKVYFSKTVLCGKEELSPGLWIPIKDGDKIHCSLIPQISNQDGPALFGLPPNSERGMQKSNSGKIIQQLRYLQREADGEIRLNKENLNFSLQPLLDLWKNLSRDYQSNALAGIGNREEGVDNPISIFIRNESLTAYNLFSLVNESFDLIAMILHGDCPVERTATILVNDLSSGRVPETWRRYWYGPIPLISWLTKMMKCLLKTLSLMEHGWSDVATLSCMFNPAAFISSLRQQVARSTKCSMQKLRLAASWSENEPIDVSSNISALCDGLMIQGAIFDGQNLQEINACAADLVDLPRMKLTFLPILSSFKVVEEECISLPLYDSMTREKLLAEIPIPCKKELKKKWILSSVALFVG